MINGEKIGNIDLVKQLNSAAVYRLIYKEGPISRIQVSEMSQLAPASVTKITRQMIAYGLIKEVAHQASTGGRRAISLQAQVHLFHSIAVRVKRDEILMSLFDLSGQELAKRQIPFRCNTQNELIDELLHLIETFKKDHQGLIHRLIAIGICLPGLINPENGMIYHIPHIQIKAFSLTDIISAYFHLPCFVGNDISSMALAEHYFGNSTESKDSLLVNIHHGTGAGIIVNGQMFLGSSFNVGEIGHIQMDPLGKRCQCGNIGCLETQVSDPALLATVEQALSEGQISSLTQLSQLTVSDICHHANQGDALACHAIKQVGHSLGKALAIAVNLFNPQKIIIAGAITASKQLLFETVRKNLAHQSLLHFYDHLEIDVSALESVPTIGVFALIQRAMFNGSLLQQLPDNATTSEKAQEKQKDFA